MYYAYINIYRPNTTHAPTYIRAVVVLLLLRSSFRETPAAGHNITRIIIIIIIIAPNDIDRRYNAQLMRWLPKTYVIIIFLLSGSSHGYRCFYRRVLLCILYYTYPLSNTIAVCIINIKHTHSSRGFSK